MKKIAFLFSILILVSGLSGYVLYEMNFEKRASPAKLKVEAKDSKLITLKEPAKEVPPAKKNVLPNKPSATSDFKAFLQTTFENLPTRQSIREEGKDMHHASQALVSAGLELGKVLEALEEDPSLAEEALLFYRDCALSSEVLNSVRILCYSNFEKWSTALEIPFEEAMDSVPTHIRAGAQSLQDFP